ncbi:MAG: hypothetical protein AAFU85_27860, partial [Planctomycetota bacterium]
MTLRQYRYVGPAEIRDAAMDSSPAGTAIDCAEDLAWWIASQADEAQPDGSLIATFVIAVDGTLLLAPRRSEHVACAGGGPVLSAGEITFSTRPEVIEVSNQSTGFCPEPESWASVAEALDAIPVPRPDDFTTKVLFRRCQSCGERNLVKDGWFVC